MRGWCTVSGYSPWKQLERRHAKRMHGVRYWRQDFGEEAPDGESEFDVWDAKCYATFRVHSIFRDCYKKYAKWHETKTFHLVLYSRKDKDVGDLVVLRAEDYAALVEMARPD